MLTATAVVGAASLLAAGAAFAYFTATGSGTGTATAGTVSLSLTVAAPAGQLFPGGTVNVTIGVKNTSSSASLTITALKQDPDRRTTITTAGQGSCDPTVVSFTDTTVPTGAIAAGASANATGTVNMTADALNGCQGAVFSIPLLATGQTS